MKEFFNPMTKTSFFVADDRVEEYKAAGYPLAATSEEAEIEVEEPKTEEVIEVEPEEVTEEVIEEEKPEEVEEVKSPKKASKKAKK